MARRSSQGADDLRQLILTTAKSIIEQNGLPGLSAREIASRIGYSPGTLYNVFRNLDDVLLTLQVELIADIHATLAAVPKTGSPEKQLNQMSEAYVDFAIRNRHMWNTLFAHTVSADTKVPKELHERVLENVRLIRDVISPLMPGASTDEVDDMVRAAWAGVHGITAIAVTEKAPYIGPSNALKYAMLITDTFCLGLKQRYK
jgi:AcrR family transcriptional regulator